MKRGWVKVRCIKLQEAIICFVASWLFETLCQRSSLFDTAPSHFSGYGEDDSFLRYVTFPLLRTTIHLLSRRNSIA